MRINHRTCSSSVGEQANCRLLSNRTAHIGVSVTNDVRLKSFGFSHTVRFPLVQSLPKLLSELRVAEYSTRGYGCGTGVQGAIFHAAHLPISMFAI
jgi:hypothetical protein